MCCFETAGAGLAGLEAAGVGSVELVDSWARLETAGAGLAGLVAAGGGHGVPGWYQG